jgi:hypothetical protein
VTSRSRHAHVIHMLDSSGTLLARSLQGFRASRLGGVACSVAIAIGISLSMAIQPLEDGLIDLTPKDYIRTLYSKDKALCLIKLYGKESAFNRYAIGNPYGDKQAYGIPQLKNPAIAHLSSIEQVNYGIDYIEHRYSGDTCLAYAHYLKKGWH